MPLFISILSKNILPTFIVIGAGVYLDRQLHIDVKALSRTAMYLLTPCLVFSSIAHSAVDPLQFGQMLLFVLVITVMMVLLALLIGRLLRWSQRTTDALVLSVAFLNAGNFGLSIVLFAYGEAGLELATAFFVGTNLACNTLGAYMAARGTGGGLKALKRVLLLPGPYAFAAAIALRALGLTLPALLDGPVQLIGRASVPIMLLMLGIQLSQTTLRGRVGQIGVGVTVRLVFGAAAALLLAPLMGLQGLARQVAVVEASTPTAVTSALMAIEFDADADFVSSVILVSTVLSSMTLTLLMMVLA
jgi:hypothetical protein